MGEAVGSDIVGRIVGRDVGVLDGNEELGARVNVGLRVGRRVGAPVVGIGVDGAAEGGGVVGDADPRHHPPFGPVQKQKYPALSSRRAWQPARLQQYTLADI